MTKGITIKEIKEGANESDGLIKAKVIGPIGSASNALDNWQKQSWLEIKDWLVIFKVFILIGVTIFTIGQFTGVSDTDLAAYIWFAFALIITWVLSLRLVIV